MLLGGLLGKAGVRCRCSQHLLCPVCSHPAPAVPCVPPSSPWSALGAPTLLQAVPAQPSTFLLPSWELRHRWVRTLPQPSGRPVPDTKPNQLFLRTCPKIPSLKEEQ